MAYPETFPVTAAQQIADLTRVVSDASRAVAGRPVNVEVIPGVLPGAPSISQLLASPLEAGKLLDPTQQAQPGGLGGNLVSTELPQIDETFKNLQVASPGGVPTTLNGTVEVAPTGELQQSLLATVNGVLSTISDIVEFTVSYSVLDADGNPLEFGTDYTLLNEAATPLSAGVLIRPPFIDDGLLANPGRFTIAVKIGIRVQLPAGGPHDDVDKIVEIPVVVPAVPVPAILVLAANPEFSGGDDRLALVLRQQSPHQTVSDVVNALNGLMDVLGGLHALLPIVPIADSLTVLTQLLATIPRVYVAFGDVPDLESYGDLRSTHGAMLLFGLEGTQVRFYDDTSFADWRTDVTVPATQVASLSIPVGYVYYPSLYDQWQTGDGNKSPESLEWLTPAAEVNLLMHG
jgi:hypothetical protein